MMCTFRTKLLCSSETIHRIFIFLGRGQHYSQFYPKFRCHGNGSRWAKMRLAALNGPSPKTPVWAQKFRQNLLRKPSYSQFYPKFRCHGNGGRSRKMQLAAFDGPYPKTPLQVQKSRKNLLRKPSYSQFCPKFRCHGNGGRSGKKAIGSIRWPIPENPPISAKISQKSLTQAEL